MLGVRLSCRRGPHVVPIVRYMSATLIINNDRCTGEYHMFDVRSYSLDGEVDKAVLSGPLFLEIGETLTLRVSGDDEDETKIEVQAIVQAIAEEEQLMTVRLVDLDKVAKAALKATKLAKVPADR